MITVATMLWDHTEKSYDFSRCYSEEWVHRLYDGFARNLTIPFKFCLFTDRIRELERPIEQYLFERRPIDYGSCIEPFKLPGPKIVLGLDTIITGNVDALAQWAIDGKSFLLPIDPYQPHHACNGVAVCPEGLDLWSTWNGENDMAWCRSFPHEYLDDVFGAMVKSYKGHVAQYGLKDTRIVYFHGEGKPHELPGVKWVDLHWGEPLLNKVEYIEKLNNDPAKMLLNAQENMKLEIPWFAPQKEHNRTAMVVGGGPSLNDTLKLLRSRRGKKTDIFSLNGTHDFLISRNIKPDYLVMLDSRPGNVTFVQNPKKGIKYLMGAQCDPVIFEALKGFDVTLWLNEQPGMQDLVRERQDKPVVLVCGGNTVGLKTLSLCYLMGYRKFDVYGFDSCYQGEENHAYPQPLNANEDVREVYAGGRKFRASPWMCKQAEWFQRQAVDLVERGCDVRINGDGLISHMIREGNNNG